MKFYQFHIGDFYSATHHLDETEDLAYRRLIDLYYMQESALDADIPGLARSIRMRDKSSQIESVLQEFFTLREGQWHHKRCDEELAKMSEKQAKAKASAAASVRVRSSERSTNAQRTLNERSANVERTLNERSTNVQLPLTNTNNQYHKPLNNKQEPEPEGAMAIALRDLGVVVTSQHPTLLKWLEDGITVQQAVDAVTLTRMRKPYPEPIPAAYLDKVLRSPQTTPQANKSKLIESTLEALRK